jgi:hypothetical protein
VHHHSGTALLGHALAVVMLVAVIAADCTVAAEAVEQFQD